MLVNTFKQRLVVLSRHSSTSFDAMPSPRGLPFFGTTLSLIAAGAAPHLHEYVDARHRQLGPVFREKIGPLDAVFLCDAHDMRRSFVYEGKYPAHLKPDAWMLYNEMYGSKRGLFFMEGEEWLTHRHIMNDLLLKNQNVRTLRQPCDMVATDLVSYWKNQTGSEVLGLEKQMYLWSTAIMLAVLLGPRKFAHLKQDLHAMIVDFADGLHLIMEKSVSLSLFPPKLAAALQLPIWTSFVEVVDKSLSSVNELLLKLMPECDENDGVLGGMISSGIKQENILRIIVDLIIAAGDTSAYTMEWILYSLAQHPDVQEELYTELNGLTDPNDIMQSKLLANIMREVLRLYPVAPFILRYLSSDGIIGGYSIPAGQLTILSIYTSGRDEKYFENPAKFWPQRWSRDSVGRYAGASTPFASLPFAMGARSCIGRKIAETELMMTTARLVQQFKLDLIDPSPTKMILRFVGVPDKLIRLSLTKR